MYKYLASFTFASAVALTASASFGATATAGPGDFNGGWATSITYEDDNSVARRGVANDRDNPLNALGAGDGEFFEIGFGSTVDLTFGTLFDTSASLVEITFGDPDNFPESVDVLVGIGGAFTFAGILTNVQAANMVSIVLPGGGPWDTLRLIDTSPLSSSAESDNLGALGGFDIDAARVSPIPVPAAGFLLVGGLGALGALRRRRKS